ncbi:MAG: DNA alkylation repair protein [Bacilli bacterium]|nr:DNA alkylation repair protein [Bacilli bacterium]
MILIKENWTKKDGKEFIKYLESLQKPDKIVWTRKIVNTSMPLLAITKPSLDKIANQITKGNYISFLNLELNEYYECLAIRGTIISNIQDFETMKKYLNDYANEVDNWALCDILKFKIKNNEENYYNLLLEYLRSDKTFVRRIAFVILFNYIPYDEYLEKIFAVINNLYNEKEYYVNMINAWLFCELFIKRRKETIVFLKTNKLNKFTINKGISKCRDSYRVSVEDKEMLLKYKK